MLSAASLIQNCRTLADLYPDRVIYEGCAYLIDKDGHVDVSEEECYSRGLGADDLQPLCIVAHALKMAGYFNDPQKKVKLFYESNQECFLNGTETIVPVEGHDLQLRWIKLCQTAQDRNLPWKDAVRYADYHYELPTPILEPQDWYRAFAYA